MINEPDIFLLEETTVGLDLEIATSTREPLRHLLNERGLTVFISPKIAE